MKHLPKPTVVYQTERMTVTRMGFRDFMLHVDGELVSFHEAQHEAEHAGAMRLEEEMRAIVKQDTLHIEELTLTREGGKIAVEHEDGRKLGTINIKSGQTTLYVGEWLNGRGWNVKRVIDALA